MINPPVTPSISGSNFKEKYNLIQFHFHWGFNPYQGSEHKLDGNKYPLEVKLKFHKWKKIGSKNISIVLPKDSFSTSI